MRVAAIQMKAQLAAVAENCAAAERLTRQAVAAGAELVVLPEFFTSSVAFHPLLLDAARPIDGLPGQLLRRLARESGAIVGGSFIADHGNGVFNTFVLAFPGGSTFFHDKDLPTMWENCYYEPGSDDGVLETPAGAIGVAMCWELIRTQTVERLMGRVGLVVGGSCWWDLPYGSSSPELEAARQENVALYEKTPPTFARLLRVPFVHAAHCGEFEGLTPGSGDLPYRSRWLGRAQVVDGHGKILALAPDNDGEAVVIADVKPGTVEAGESDIPDTFWLHDMPAVALAAWETQNLFGRQYYEEVTKPHRLRIAGSGEDS
ncbi:MAG: carbon-nitrogen hydrolase family protein [bacterium]|nr:carbon-nitrogen hydrolase family protein [bacterium]